MSRISAVVIATITTLATPACESIGQEPDPPASVTVEADGSASYVDPDTGERIRVDNLLDDPAGLAGLEVSIGGAVDNAVFDIEDVKDGRAHVLVPDMGFIEVSVRLLDASNNVVARGYEIAEPARNYANERLWMTVWRWRPDECVDLCME